MTSLKVSEMSISLPETLSNDNISILMKDGESIVTTIHNLKYPHKPKWWCLDDPNNVIAPTPGDYCISFINKVIYQFDETNGWIQYIHINQLHRHSILSLNGILATPHLVISLKHLEDFNDRYATLLKKLNDLKTSLLNYGVPLGLDLNGYVGNEASLGKHLYTKYEETFTCEVIFNDVIYFEDGVDLDVPFMVKNVKHPFTISFYINGCLPIGNVTITENSDSYSLKITKNIIEKLEYLSIVSFTVHSEEKQFFNFNLNTFYLKNKQALDKICETLIISYSETSYQKCLPSSILVVTSPTSHNELQLNMKPIGFSIFESEKYFQIQSTPTLVQSLSLKTFEITEGEHND